MPIYQYACDECESEFDEIIKSDETEKYMTSHPCPACYKDARRLMSTFAFGFKSEVRGTSGVHGNSGVHDWDYPSLDKAVARSSDKRWEAHRKRQVKIDKVRKESGVHAVTMDSNGKVAPLSKDKIEKRTKAMSLFKKLKKESDVK